MIKTASIVSFSELNLNCMLLTRIQFSESALQDLLKDLHSIFQQPNDDG